MTIEANVPTAVQEATDPPRLDPEGSVGPSVYDTTALVTLEMSETQVGEWWKEVERARNRVSQREATWDLLLKEYLPVVKKSGDAESVKVAAHFRNVHTKIGNLFYRSPELTLEPRGRAYDQIPNPANPQQVLTMEDVVTIKQEVLNWYLGDNGVDAEALMDDLLFDVLAYSGIGGSKIGYCATIKEIDQPVMGPDPNVMITPGSVLGLGQQAPPIPQMGPDGQPLTKKVPVVIHEDWYWRRIPAKKLLFNSDLRSTRFDRDATWLGFDFFMTPDQAKKMFVLSDEDVAKATEDTRIYQYDEDKTQDNQRSGLVRGVEVWPKASLFTDEVHPLAINQLVLIDGIKDRPVVWRKSPDQTFDDEGKLSEDSMVGFPIHILTIRPLTDSPYPPSDSAFTNNDVKQMNTHRQQSVKLRDAAVGKYLYDMDVFDADEITNLKNAEVGAYVGVKSGALQGGKDRVITTTAQATQTQDDWRLAQMMKQDMEETLGLSATQIGTQTETVRTATEISESSASANGRQEKEQSRVLAFYISGARKLDALLMRYATATEYVSIAGQDGARKLMAWNNQLISGRYLYKLSPDSQLKVDTARDRQQTLNLYNIASHDPLFNRALTLRRLARQFGLDPSKMVLPQPPPPPQKSDPPSVSFAFKGEDFLNPLIGPLLLQLLATTEGMKPPAPEPGPMQPPMAGKGAVVAHEAGKSGARPNEPGSTDHRLAASGAVHRPPTSGPTPPPGGQS